MIHGPSSRSSRGELRKAATCAAMTDVQSNSAAVPYPSLLSLHINSVSYLRGLLCFDSRAQTEVEWTSRNAVPRARSLCDVSPASRGQELGPREAALPSPPLCFNHPSSQINHLPNSDCTLPHRYSPLGTRSSSKPPIDITEKQQYHSQLPTCNSYFASAFRSY